MPFNRTSNFNLDFGDKKRTLFIISWYIGYVTIRTDDILQERERGRKLITVES